MTGTLLVAWQLPLYNGRHHPVYNGRHHPDKFGPL